MLRLYLIEISYYLSTIACPSSGKSRRARILIVSLRKTNVRLSQKLFQISRESHLWAQWRDKESVREGGGEYILSPCLPGPWIPLLGFPSGTQHHSTFTPRGVIPKAIAKFCDNFCTSPWLRFRVFEYVEWHRCGLTNQGATRTSFSAFLSFEA